MGYSTVLFDLDHTLLDSATSERLAFAHAMERAGVNDASRYFGEYVGINRALWAAVERGELSPDDLKVLRFQLFVEATALDADVAILAEAYVSGLGAYGELYAGTAKVLDALLPYATMGLITNGLGEVQRARICRLGLDRYFAGIAISGEIGIAKPGAEIFEYAFGKLGFPDRAATLIVGDSLTSDIQGGINYGIGTCWFNPAGTNAPTGITIDHEVASLRQVLPIVLDGVTPL